MTFRLLDSSKILGTLDRLAQRIEERFPKSGLAGVSRDLGTLSRECAEQAERLRRPNWPIRVAAAVVIALIIVASGMLLYQTISGRFATTFSSVGEYVQAIEAAVNDIVFLGIAVFFLVTIEGRIKRRRALRYIHQLRSVAHVVDMHQLTKDPDRISSPAPDTASSPERQMTPAQLGRYLDYCSELLSICGKVAALFVQEFNDALVLAAVNEVEGLTTGLSRKIWQKISILEAAAKEA